MKLYIKAFAFFSILFFYNSLSFGQDRTDSDHSFQPDERPKLVVGIIVDQMRYEYLSRFWDKFGEDGFKRLVNEGFLFTNHHFNYFPTYTGPGHAAVYTGTTPSVNGIVGNSWYNRKLGHPEYVVSDSTVQTVGGSGEAGQMSPVNLLSSTITDELKSHNLESKVIAVSIKDRGAILPAGHLGDLALWYDSETGNFISSTWYVNELPDWVAALNDENISQEYSRQTWQPLLDIEEYTETGVDDRPYEGAFEGEEAPVFPHEMNGSLSRIISSPYGNDLIAALAKAAVAGGELGSDSITDFLAVSFSSTDYVGHRFGPNSIEVADTYLRLDKNIAGLLSYLDEEVGEGNYLVFLTADHGAVDVPASLVDRGLPGGKFDSESVIDSLKTYLNNRYGTADWVESYGNQQVYLNREAIQQEGISLQNMQHKIARFLLQFEGVASTNTAHNFVTEGYTERLQAMYQRGHYPGRSGDVYIQLAPGWLDSSYPTGTSHGSPYNYDTHVPLIFYGWHIPHGASSEKTVIPQIAPTISDMLHIQFPSGSMNDILEFK